MIKNIREVKKCPSCYSDNIVYKDDYDQVVCQECGGIFEPLTPKDEEALEKNGHITSR